MSLQVFVVSVERDERVKSGELIAAIRCYYNLGGAPAGVTAVESEMTRRPVFGRLAATVALTPAQARVLREMARPGEPTAKAIALELGIGARTARRHMLDILERLGVGNRQAAVLRAIQLGLVEWPGEASA